MKKAIKIALMILLISSMVFVLTGCGDQEEKTTKEKSESIKEEEKEQDFSMGEWKNDVYTNDFLGLKFNLPDGWTYLSDKELASQFNNGLELLNEDQKERVEKALESTGVYYLQAKEPINNNNVIVFTEKIPEGISEEYYLQQVSNQLAVVESVTYNIGEIKEEKISNKEYTTLELEIEDYGILQKHYIYIKGDYVVGIIITSATGEEVFDEVIGKFE